MRPPTKKEAPRLEANGAIRGHRMTWSFPHVTHSVKQSWQHEALRLAAEYIATCRVIHRQAFERQMGGILEQMRKGAQ